MSTQQDLDRLAKASKRSALISAGGFFIILAALGYGTLQLADVERQRDAVAAERDAMSDRLAILVDSVEIVSEQLEDARCALESSRAAINAFHERRYDVAVLLYDEALECDPTNGYLLNLKAYSLFKLEELQAAITTQLQSLEAEPAYAWGYFDLARFLCAAGEFDAATEEMDTALALRPGLAAVAEGDAEFQALCGGRVPIG